MPEVSDKRQGHRKIDWFDVGACLLFLAIGALYLGRGLWHGIMHHELMPRSLLGGVIFCAVAIMFALQAVKPKQSSRRKRREKFSKRHRIGRLFVVLVALTPLSRAQVNSVEGTEPFLARERSSPCSASRLDC